MTLEIRQTTLDDISTLVKMCNETFIESYVNLNSIENMKAYMDENFNEQIISSELSDPGKNTYLAIFNNKTAGYMMTSRDKYYKLNGNNNNLELGRIYIYKKYQKNNIGKAMINYCIEYAIKNNFDSINLAVWQKNANAIGFYTHLGFEIVGSTIFVLGDEIQDDYLMKLRVK